MNRETPQVFLVRVLARRLSNSIIPRDKRTLPTTITRVWTSLEPVNKANQPNNSATMPCRAKMPQWLSIYLSFVDIILLDYNSYGYFSTL